MAKIRHAINEGLFTQFYEEFGLNMTGPQNNKE